MKIGIENRHKTVFAGISLCLAFLLLGRSLRSSIFSSVTPSAFSDESLFSEGRKIGNEGASLDPTLRVAVLQETENAVYTGSGRNIFHAALGATVVRQVLAHMIDPPSLSVTPQRPQIPLRFFGFASMLDVPKKGFFGEGDAVFVGREGQIIDRRYRILKIDLNSVEVEDLIAQTKHKLSLAE